MSTLPTMRATLNDLYQVDGKAELINGSIFSTMPSGDRPTDVAAEIFVSLRAYARSRGQGVAKTDGVGYIVAPRASGRESFSPDASFYVGPRPADPMRFIDGAPIFAVEVRSANDYGDAAEADMAAKRADYFEAGTQVIWDVDPVNEMVMAYQADDPGRSTVFHRGDSANAEPALPGWKMAVDDIIA
jgi:Uma2 family endonuclease